MRISVNLLSALVIALGARHLSAAAPACAPAVPPFDSATAKAPSSQTSGLHVPTPVPAAASVLDSPPMPLLAPIIDKAVDLPDGPRTAEEVFAGGFSPETPTVLLRYPLRSNDWWHTSNYVDLQTGAGLLDYGCRSVTYDGHTGNDLIIRDFVEMDEGRFVLAAAPGTVTEVVDGNFDRNTASNGNTANDVIVQHADGSSAYYWHLARWSTRVYAGQSVVEGQPLGLVGSSGSSTDPHVHFEVRQSGVVYEPGAGSCRAGATLWTAQQPHVFDNPASVYDAGQSSTAPDAASIKSRPPNVAHFQQTGGAVPHYLWVKLADVHSGDASRVVWLKPDGAVWFDTGAQTHSAYYSYSWWYWFTNLPTSGATGTWTVQYFLNGALKRQLNFTYNTTASQAPVASGRTVAVPKGAVRDALRGSDADSDIKAYRIVATPAHGEVKQSGPRGRYFAYVPESGYSGSDSFQFQVDDGQGAASASATMTMTVSPVQENVLRLEGEGDCIRVAATISLNLAQFTLEAWIRRTAGSAGWQGIFDRRHPTLFNSYGFSLFLKPDSRLRATIGKGFASAAADGATPIPLDRWVHVAATYSSGLLQVFVNGAPDGSAPFTGSISYAGVGDLLIGGSLNDAASDPEFFRGEIEEARAWNVARTPADLKQGGTCAFFDYPLPSSVKAWWRFQGNALDSSGNGNNGTRTAGASFLRTDSGLPLNCSVQNSDGEGGADRFDNCPLDPNPTQADMDGDGIGDMCDLCPAAPLRVQADSDRDGVGDPCDGCPFLGDTEQLDTDGDGAGDLCDPAPLNAALSVPSDQITLSAAHNRASGITTISWTPGAFAATYEVWRAALADLRAGSFGACQNSRDANPEDRTFAENQSPAAGSAFYFLVIGAASDGTRGLAGLDSNGRQRDLQAGDCS